jgi:SAM-dependent methyltransferase
MVEWSDGYVTSIDYTSGFYPGLSPISQNFSLLLRGIAPVELTDGFSYCELGCGHGFSTTLLAAANPTGAFWGVDFNPAHVSSAERLAAAARIENVTFLEQSFAEALTASMPRLDLIALHGVWSWISGENRRAIVDFINAKLKPGGVTYISYNALPGWAAHAPLRQLLVERLRGKTDITPEAINEAVGFAARVRETGAAYFAANPHSAQRLEAIASSSRNYVAHEYFNRHWSPSYHSDIAADLSAAKLVFGAPSDVAEHLDQRLLKPAVQELLKELTDLSARETVIDYYLNRQFRRDLFVRGARELSAREREERLLATRFAVIAPQPTYPFKVRFPLGEVTLEPSPYEAILNALAEQPLTLGQLLSRTDVGPLGSQAVFQAIVLLIVARLVAPTLDPEGEAERRKSTSRFNEAVLSQLGGDRQEQTLASPVLGTGVPVPYIHQVFLATKALDARLPIDTVVAAITARHQQLRKKGKPVTSLEDTRSELQEALTEFRQSRFPIYQRLGL